MAKRYTVETVGAVIDRKPVGSTIELSEKTAKHLESIGYVRIIGEVKPKPTPAKKASAPKKTAKASAPKSTPKKKAPAKKPTK